VTDQKLDEQPKDGSKWRKRYVACTELTCSVCRPALRGLILGRGQAVEGGLRMKHVTVCARQPLRAAQG